MTSKQDETAKKDLQDYAEKLLNLELNALIPSDFQLCDSKISKKPQVRFFAYVFNNIIPIMQLYLLLGALVYIF